MKTKDNPLRRIAQFELTRLFNDLSSKTRDDLETAVVRQWRTCDGRAGVITRSQVIWFTLVKEGDGYRLEVERCQNPLVDLLRDRGVDEREFAELFHRANLSQSAEFADRGGGLWRLTIDPRARQVAGRPLADSDD